MKRIIEIIKANIFFTILIVGAIVSVFLVLEIDRAYDSYDNIYFRIGILFLSGVLVGFMYVALIVYVADHNLVRKINMNLSGVLCRLSILHVPFYLIWLYPFHFMISSTVHINRYLPIIILFFSLFLIRFIFFQKNKESVVQKQRPSEKLLPLVKKNLFLAMALLFSFSVVIINYHSVKRAISPPSWDPAWYLQTSEILYQSLVRGGVIELLESFTLALGGRKAPLISILPLPFYLIFGNSEMVAMCVNYAFLILLSFYVFRIVESLSNQRAAFISVLVLHTMPLFYNMNRVFMVEYGLATIVLMYIYYLRRSDLFRKNKCNTAIGILAGLGLLMKIAFPLYVFAPTLYILILRMKKQKDETANSLLFQLLKIFVICLAICSVWYYYNIKSALSFALSAGFGELAKPYGSEFSFLALFRFWNTTFIKYGILYYYFFVGVAGIALYIAIAIIHRIRNRQIDIDIKDIIIFCLWIVFPFVVISLSVNKPLRFFLPSLAPIAIFIGIAVEKALNKIRLNGIFIGLCILFVAFPLSKMMYDLIYPKENAITERDWKTDEIVEYIYREMLKNDELLPYNIIAVSHGQLNHNTYSYIASTKHYKYPIYFTSLGYAETSIEKAIERIERFKPLFLIFEEGIEKIELADFLNRVNDDIRDIVEQKKLPYLKDKTYELPHGVKILLFKRITT